MKLNDIVKPISSQLKLSEVNSIGKYIVYGASGKCGYIDSFKVDKNYVALVKDGAGVGHVYKLNATDSFLGTMQGLVPNDNIDRDYVYYLIRYLDLGAKFNGATIPHIYFKNYGNETIKNIDYQKQVLISKELSKIEDEIFNKKIQFLFLDELVKSRFVEMFGDIFNGKSNYSTIKISEAVVPKIERAKKDFNADDEIKYLDISSVDNRKNIIIGYTDYLMKDAPSRAQQHVRKDDIVISTVRPNLNNVAKITHDYSNIVASSGFCVLRASKVEPNFLFALVSMQSFADYLASLTTGANYPAVSDKDILNFEIPNAPIEEQIKFSDFIKQVDKLKFIVQQEIKDLQELLDKKMDEYFGQ